MRSPQCGCLARLFRNGDALGALPFPLLWREGVAVDSLSRMPLQARETALSWHQREFHADMPRRSKHPPCRTKRDKDGASSTELMSERMGVLCFNGRRYP
jgi:hypothetical protein